MEACYAAERRPTSPVADTSKRRINATRAEAADHGDEQWFNLQLCFHAVIHIGAERSEAYRLFQNHIGNYLVTTYGDHFYYRFEILNISIQYARHVVLYLLSSASLLRLVLGRSQETNKRILILREMNIFEIKKKRLLSLDN